MIACFNWDILGKYGSMRSFHVQADSEFIDDDMELKDDMFHSKVHGFPLQITRYCLVKSNYPETVKHDCLIHLKYLKLGEYFFPNQVYQLKL